jgi:hypothetical protein
MTGAVLGLLSVEAEACHDGCRAFELSVCLDLSIRSARARENELEKWGSRAAASERASARAEGAAVFDVDRSAASLLRAVAGEE